MAIIRKLMHNIDSDYQIEFDFRPFIVPAIMQITQYEIERLRSKKILVFEFGSTQQCRDMRVKIARYKNTHPNKENMTLEQMEKAHQEIIAPLHGFGPSPAPAALPVPSAAGHGGRRRSSKLSAIKKNS